MLFISFFLSFYLIINFSNESGHIFLAEERLISAVFGLIWPLQKISTNQIDIHAEVFRFMC